MSKKMIIWSIIAVVLVAAGVVAALYFLKPQTKPAAKGPETSNKYADVPFKADTSKDFGACDLLNIDVIKATLGTAANTLQNAFNVGRILVGQGTGDEAQNCYYAFKPGAGIENSFYTGVYVYGSTASRDDNLKNIDPTATPVDGIGDSASYLVIKDEALKTTEYNLRVNVGQRYFTFAIKQPTTDESFDTTSAQTALEKLAKTVDYSAFASKQ